MKPGLLWSHDDTRLRHKTASNSTSVFTRRGRRGTRAVGAPLLLCLCVFITPSVRANSETLMTHNFVADLSCRKPAGELAQQMCNSTGLHLAAIQWSSTHIVRDWNVTACSLLTAFQIAADAHMRRMHIFTAPGDVVYSMHAQYVSVVRLPKVLAALVTLEVPLVIEKHIYIVSGTMYVLTEVSEIPFLGSCVISTRAETTPDHRVMSRNSVTYTDLPWYASWARSAVQHKLRESLEKQTSAMAECWCGHC